MDQIVLYDGEERESLLPLTYLRPCCLCRVGIRTIEEKWKAELKGHFSYLTAPYLQPLFSRSSKPETAPESSMRLYINGACIPNTSLVFAIKELSPETVLVHNDIIVAFQANKDQLLSIESIQDYTRGFRRAAVSADCIRYPEDILRLSRKEFLSDYNYLTKQRKSASLDPSMKLRGKDVFIGKNVVTYDAILNTSEGPIYIDDEVEIMENAVIKGPVYIGPYSKIHVGAKVYADTMLGPHCKIGGEIKRTTIFGFSNKAHDGFLGDSVLGNWCNLGADTNNSNMKNTYGNVSLWDIKNQAYRSTDRQFLGLILGDHTMSAINSSFNTGSVAGIFANILDRTPERYTPSFSWGKEQKYKVDKAVAVAKTVMLRRGLLMKEGYERAIRHLAAQND